MSIILSNFHAFGSRPLQRLSQSRLLSTKHADIFNSEGEKPEKYEGPARKIAAPKKKKKAQ